MRLTVGVHSCTNRFYIISIGEVKEAWWIMLHPENEVNLNRVARPLLHYLCGSAKCIQGTFTRECKRKNDFSFVLRSLNRTFVA